MLPVDTITRKRNGIKLSADEIEFMIRGYTQGSVADYQMSAFLMAIYFRGMDYEESSTLVRLMRDSGEALELSAIGAPKIDKHSTGGVGDKVSLILAPIVAACGLVNPMISGRSLGHTGGTLDKLEAIPGFNTQIDLATFYNLLEKNGCALIGQTPEICPADKKLYALRDATATVDSIPLICGSILSKKLAENLDALILDVKCGNGAIFEDPGKSQELAHALVQTAHQFSLKTIALLTQMDQPLGNAIGNWVETEEAILTLRGEGPDDLLTVTLALSALMLWAGGIESSVNEALQNAKRCLESGAAFEKFRTIVEAQGGDVRVIESPEQYPQPKYQELIKSDTDGYVHAVRARLLGTVSMQIGAGRTRKEDGIDALAGMTVHKKVGDQVARGEPLVALQADKRAIDPQLVKRARTAFQIEQKPCSPPPLLLGVVDEFGQHEWDAFRK